MVAAFFGVAAVACFLAAVVVEEVAVVGVLGSLEAGVVTEDDFAAGPVDALDTVRLAGRAFAGLVSRFVTAASAFFAAAGSLANGTLRFSIFSLELLVLPDSLAFSTGFAVGFSMDLVICFSGSFSACSSGSFCGAAPLLVVMVAARARGVDGWGEGVFAAGSPEGATGELLTGSSGEVVDSGLSGTLVAAVSAPSVVSLLRRLRESLDSPLGSLWRPSLPSFSTAMKLARTFPGVGLSETANRTHG